MFANVPDCFDHAVAGFMFYRSKKRKLSVQLRELGQLRAGYARGSRFVFSQHCKAARAVGPFRGADPRDQGAGRWRPASRRSSARCWPTPTAWCCEGGRVPDDVFDALRAELGDVEILELTYITCMYDMHAVISRALRLEYDDVDDPITEVPAPAASNDPMAAVHRA